MRQLLRSKSFGIVTAIVAGSILLAGLAALLAPIDRTSMAPSSSRKVDDSDLANYAGDEACRNCHPTAYADHQASNHHKALRTMNRDEMGALCPAPGRIPNSPYSLAEREGKFYFDADVASTPDKRQSWPLDYAFGSGKTGLTFVSMLDGKNIVELKMSYFPGDRTWKVTPGQTLDHPEYAGRTRDLNQSRRCFECHSIAISRNAFTPRKTFMGAGCESCHGPARAHIEAIRSGSSNGHMERLGTLGAREFNARCGACHSTQQDIAGTKSAISAKMTYRFQPYGIMQSRCFQESANKLSCLNCHIPHQNDAVSPAFYERACLSCHSGPSAPPKTVRSSSTPGRVCPVNARTDCIRCHMPKRDFKFATREKSGILMTEHKIAIYPAP